MWEKISSTNDITNPGSTYDWQIPFPPMNNKSPFHLWMTNPGSTFWMTNPGSTYEWQIPISPLTLSDKSGLHLLMINLCSTSEWQILASPMNDKFWFNLWTAHPSSTYEWSIPVSPMNDKSPFYRWTNPGFTYVREKGETLNKHDKWPLRGKARVRWTRLSITWKTHKWMIYEAKTCFTNWVRRSRETQKSRTDRRGGK